MKTHSKFDYDLWTTVENGVKKYWSRVKSTGEETEVSKEIFRFMNNEDKKIRREITDTIEAAGTIYSLDAPGENGLTLYDIIADPLNLDESNIQHTLLEHFKKTLPDSQRNFFVEVIEHGQTIQEYAVVHNVSGSAVYKVYDKIKKKLKKFALGG